MALKPRGSPAWMVTFADLMSLLTTFFILLLSMSEIDAQRYRQIAGALREAFGVQWLLQRSEAPRPDSLIEGKPGTIIAVPETAAPSAPPPAEGKTEAVDATLQRFQTGLGTDIDRGLLEVGRNKEGELLISFRHEAAFESGSAVVLPAFEPVIDRIGHLIATTRGAVLVAGHTDDRPISTPRFRSNWDLSTARAVSVVHRFLERPDVQPSRLTAEGHADTEPLVPNDSDLHRARNRRVEIRLKDQQNHAGLDRRPEHSP